MSPKEPSLQETFGGIDIYLFDQLQKGRIRASMKVLDAGCGPGRNLIYLARMGCDITAVDRDSNALERARARVKNIRPELDIVFRVAGLDELPFPDGTFDVVLCSAVLHFADNEGHFDAMVSELWRVLAPEGLFFARLASSIGIEDRIEPRGNSRFGLPDGSERFLVGEGVLLEQTTRQGGVLLDPIKTTNVQGLRCMTTWVASKPI